VITYEQARKDHEYLWSIYGPAYDMAGGYVDQEDLVRLLESPTKATARKCYCKQIDHWFEAGFDDCGYMGIDEILKITEGDKTVSEIAERHGQRGFVDCRPQRTRIITEVSSTPPI